MPLPNLLHPIPVIIEQWIASETIYDEETREPIQQAARSETVEIPGQISWDVKDDVIVGEGGTVLNAKGYVLFRYIDLQTRDVTLKVQDGIKKLGWQNVNLYIVAFKPMGHYQDRGGATLVKAYFNDRSPSRST